MFDYIGTTELSDNEQFVGFNKNHKHYNLQKTDDISRCHHWFPREMTSEKCLQKFHLMTRHYRDMGNSSDWSCHGGNLPQPIRSTTQIWVVTRHQYGISALVPQTSFRGEASGDVANVGCFLRLLRNEATQVCLPFRRLLELPPAWIMVAHDGTKTWTAARSWATAAESFHQQLAAQQVRWYGMTDECTRCPYKSKNTQRLT